MVREKRFGKVIVALLVMFAGVAFTQSAQAKMATSLINTSGLCSPGPLRDQTGDPEFPNARLVPCNQAKKKLAAGTYLVTATAGWYAALDRTVFYPSSGRCQLQVNNRVVLGSETRFGSYATYGESLYQGTIFSQGIVKLKSRKQAFVFRCAQNKGYFKLARSTMLAVRIG